MTTSLATRIEFLGDRGHLDAGTAPLEPGQAADAGNDGGHGDSSDSGGVGTTVGTGVARVKHRFALPRRTGCALQRRCLLELGDAGVDVDPLGVGLVPRR